MCEQKKNQQISVKTKHNTAMKKRNKSRREFQEFCLICGFVSEIFPVSCPRLHLALPSGWYHGRESPLKIETTITPRASRSKKIKIFIIVKISFLLIHKTEFLNIFLIPSERDDQTSAFQEFLMRLALTFTI